MRYDETMTNTYLLKVAARKGRERKWGVSPISRKISAEGGIRRPLKGRLLIIKPPPAAF